MLKGVILSGCIAGIAASLADAAVSDKYRKQIRTILALILIIVISQPFLGVDFDALVRQYIAEFDSMTVHETQQTLADNVITQAETELSDYITAKLEAAGIKPLSVSIELTVTQDGLAQVERTDVVIMSEQLERYDDVKRIVAGELLQGTVNVSWEAEGV